MGRNEIVAAVSYQEPRVEKEDARTHGLKRDLRCLRYMHPPWSFLPEHESSLRILRCVAGAIHCASFSQTGFMNPYRGLEESFTALSRSASNRHGGRRTA